MTLIRSLEDSLAHPPSPSRGGPATSVRAFHAGPDHATVAALVGAGLVDRRPPGGPRWSLSARAPPRHRRHGGGLAGGRPRPRSPRRPQVAEAVAGVGPGGGRALPPRGGGRRRADPPEHRRRARRVRGRRPPSGGDAARRWQEPASAARRAEAIEPRAHDPHRHVRRRRARRRPPGRLRAPRRQAGQHPGHPGRTGAAHGLRHRQGPRWQRRRPHQRERDDGHGEVPVARTGSRPQARRTGRSVLARPGALRVPGRTGAVHRPERHRHGAGPPAA